MRWLFRTEAFVFFGWFEGRMGWVFKWDDLFEWWLDEDYWVVYGIFAREFNECIFTIFLFSGEFIFEEDVDPCKETC